ncbi:FkbM family methyltransferase [Luminiphilus sp.]|nr:FkbM family methyltransferase [Luminiphilus sp.]
MSFYSLIRVKVALKSLLKNVFSLHHIKNKNKYCGLSSLDDVYLFIDVGANVGNFMPKIKRACAFSVENAILVEPDERCHSELERTAVLCGNNVEIVTKLVCNSSGKQPFYIFDDSARNSLLEGDGIGEAQSIRNIDAIKGSALLEEFRDLAQEKTNILKIDVQGAEATVLESFGADLCIFSFIILEITFTNHYKMQADFLKLLELLNPSHSYAGNLSEVYGPNGEIEYMNAVFKRLA